MTDHRVGRSIHDIQSVMEGGHGLVELMEALRIHYETKALEALTKTIASDK